MRALENKINLDSGLLFQYSIQQYYIAFVNNLINY